MRSFSNIMTNFAGNLHLLVDSILAKKESEKRKYLPKCFADCGFYTIFARRNSHRLTEIT